MILTDKEIMSKNLIEPFSEKQLTPNGYDVACNDNIKIHPGKCKVIVSEETVSMPNNIVGEPWLKQKYARQGIIASCSMIDAGFNGTLALVLHNGGHKTIEIKKGAPVVQIVFIKLKSSVIKDYTKRSGNYQNQKETLIE